MHDALWTTLTLNIIALAQSIPAYIERSTLMIILVPTCEHVDRTGELCDYSSWRRRGWCRLELMGSQLSRSQLRVMLCNGGLAQPELLTPIDIIHLLPGMGHYTCCARNHGEQSGQGDVVDVVAYEGIGVCSMSVTNTCRNHLHFLTRSPADFGDGPGTATCDLLAVEGVLSTMIDAKVEHLFTLGLVFEARVYAGMKHWFMRGLPSSSDNMKGDASDGGACAVSAKEGLAAAIEMFRWRGEEEEAEETRRSGVDLMFWSTLADNLGAVRALATEGNAFPGGRLRFHRPGKL